MQVMPVTPVIAPPGTDGTTPPVVADAVRNGPQARGIPPYVGEAKALVVTVAMVDGWRYGEADARSLGLGPRKGDLPV